ncbi:MAG: hypothetical protein QE271_14050 [Bacteriovoracaceae bacterium]|nr:hypothetical protein [Bacteriovoracaceae bacterium]
MKNKCKTIIQWALVVSLMILSGCGRRTVNQDSNLSLISAINGGGPFGQMVTRILQERPCPGGVPHSASSWVVDTQTGATSLTNQAINTELTAVTTAIGGFDFQTTQRNNPYFNNQVYQNSIVVAQDLGTRLNLVFFMCGLSTYDPYSNVSINNNSFTGGTLLPVFNDNRPRVIYDTSVNTCAFAQVAALNFKFQVGGNTQSPNGNALPLSFSTIDLTLGPIGGFCTR